MPYIQSTKRINPLDLNKNVKIGVAFPLDDVNLFEGTQTVKEQIKSNLINVLLTEKGERPYEPNFGVGLKSYLFESNIDTSLLEEAINNQIDIYIPEISIQNVQVDFSPDEHIFYIK